MTLSAVTNVHAKTLRLYSLGNSLTADTYRTTDANYMLNGLDDLAAGRGNTIVQGKNIRWGMGLATQWDDYTRQTQNSLTWEIYKTSHGFFQTAFANNTWDAITLQPFVNSLDDEMAAARGMASVALQNPANAHATLYLYAPWPGRAYNTHELTFATTWQQPYTDTTVAPGNFTSRDYFRQCYQTLKGDFPQSNVWFIPSGEVFEELAKRITTGQIPGVSDPQVLYNDDLHASQTFGQYAAALTYYACVMNEDPRGLSVPAEYQGSVTADAATAVQNAVWQVLSSQAQRTNLWAAGDISGDGLVNFDDLLTLAQNYGGDGIVDEASVVLPYRRFDGDLTGDGHIDFDDLLSIAQNYEPSSLTATFESDWALAQSLVPEPAAVTLLAVTLPLRRRRR